MKKLTTILFLSLCSAFIIPAQEQSQNVSKYQNGLGMGAGFTTGYGIQYRHFFKNKFGMQGSFAPYKDDNETIISLGLTLMYRLVETERTNLFIYQGTHFYYDKETYDYGYYNPDYYSPDPYNNYNYNINDKFVNIGAGIGIEISIFKRVGLNFMAGYAGYNNFKFVTMTGEVGTYFYF